MIMSYVILHHTLYDMFYTNAIGIQQEELRAPQDRPASTLTGHPVSF